MQRLSNLFGGNGKEVRDNAFYKSHFGPNTVVTCLGKINIVHLDSPSPELIQRRIEEITREEIGGEAWDDDCPLCQMFKNDLHDVIYSRIPGDKEMDDADERISPK